MSIKNTTLAKTFDHMEIKGFKKPQIDINDPILKGEEYEIFLALEKQNKDDNQVQPDINAEGKSNVE